MGLNGNQLKLIAVVTMLIDHIGYLIVGEGLGVATVTGKLDLDWVPTLYTVLRSIGRIAFPIFCFLLVEGFFHTKNRKKYAVRLGIFALISEIPFDVFCTGKLVEWQVQNVMITLLLGLIMKEILENMKKENKFFLQMLVILLFVVISWGLRSDYHYIGIMLIALFYLFHENRKKACMAGFLWMAVTAQAFWFYPGLIVSFLLLVLYNGQKGKGRGGYGFYLFYPVHMLALYFIFYLCFPIV